ncbi:PRC-barrel domain-containing protein [Actinoplanes sp. LDG1-06]|uniref:PRC-barrel domain-containing protein n=1 Tax=Paractinoplanes ovalisporus TaxID=2810368 RepID=A0ABS2A756_9ACTN|nr:PRC-barrel domain-containing protein [Actinoplanes ovalisporus]MBM2615672.1 PRC-barrel domain-containing protein [Actinoplanes ovalisporus]
MPRASDFLGRRIHDEDGRYLGRIVDVAFEDELTEAVVVRGPWGRLLGYEREQVRGPWLVETLARWILRREMTTVPWDPSFVTPDPRPVPRDRVTPGP